MYDVGILSSFDLLCQLPDFVIAFAFVVVVVVGQTSRESRRRRR